MALSTITPVSFKNDYSSCLSFCSVQRLKNLESGIRTHELWISSGMMAPSTSTKHKVTLLRLFKKHPNVAFVLLLQSGKVIPEISRRNYDVIRDVIGEFRGRDVTGGMASKVQNMVELCSSDAIGQVWIQVRH